VAPVETRGGFLFLPTILCAGAHALRCVALVPIRFDDDDDDDATAPHCTALHAGAACSMGDRIGRRQPPRSRSRTKARVVGAQSQPGAGGLGRSTRRSLLTMPALPCQAHQQQAPSRGVGACLTVAWSPPHPTPPRSHGRTHARVPPFRFRACLDCSACFVQRKRRLLTAGSAAAAVRVS
jgi:hypothetical protein